MNNIQDLFMPYDLALQMKEKGFNESCIAFWDGGGNAPLLNIVGEMRTLKGGWQKNEQSLFTKHETNAAAPLYQQAQDWLREEHGIDLKFEPTIKAQYDGFIQQYMGWKYIGTFSTHREALTEAIREALKLIPNI